MQHQKGIALITILIMVALATILAATIAKRQWNTTENTAYLTRQNQSLLYAKSAEAFFSEILLDDIQNASESDHLKETWAQPMPAFPVEDGYVTGIMEDESGKFNLNSLVKEDGTVNEVAKKWFEQILVRVGLPQQLSEAVIDWQDPDDIPVGAMGAEANYYQGLQQGYLPSNNLFYAVEELKQVRGFEGKNYQLIEPYISALPQRDTQVNINTSPALVLASLDANLQLNAVVSALEKQRSGLEHFKDVNELWEIDEFKNIDDTVKTTFGALLSVKSNFFKAKIEVKLGGRIKQFTSYFVRDDKAVNVVLRSTVPFQNLNNSKQ